MAVYHGSLVSLAFTKVIYGAKQPKRKITLYGYAGTSTRQPRKEKTKEVGWAVRQISLRSSFVIPRTPFRPQHDFFQAMRLCVLGQPQMVKGAQKGFLICTLQHLAILKIGNIVGAFIQIRGNMGGKQDGAWFRLNQMPEEMQQFLPGNGI